MTKTIVLTSSKNFRWLSMQEIIPYVVTSWKSLEDKNHIVEVIDVDEVNIFKMMKDILDVDNIVCTCFTVEIIRMVTTFRKKMGLDFKAFFYVHGQATISMWPFLKWGGKNFLRKSDFLVVSCKRDIDCLKLSFEEPQILLHPFFLRPSYNLKQNFNDSSFIYIGRVSEQKNLHSILLAISLISNEMRAKGSIFKCIGGGDTLGTPVTGTPPIDYLGYLKDLAKRLKIEDLVEFAGHIDRSDFPEYLANQKATFISASLHSDENFGMAPFQYLCAGGRAILTNWGGYADFSDYFSNISYLPVILKDNGAHCDVSEIANEMLKSLKISQSVNSIDLSIDHIDSEVLSELKNKAITQREGSDRAIKATAFSLELLEKREFFYNNTKSGDRNHGSQIFDSFEDPNLLEVSKAYGANVDEKKFDFTKIKLLPYVELDDDSIFFKHPHKGKKTIARVGEQRNEVDVFWGSKVELSKEEIKELYNLGCVTSLP